MSFINLVFSGKKGLSKARRWIKERPTKTLEDLGLKDK